MIIIEHCPRPKDKTDWSNSMSHKEPAQASKAPYWRVFCVPKSPRPDLCETPRPPGPPASAPGPC